MSIEVITSGRVHDAPQRIGSQRGYVVAFVLATPQDVMCGHQRLKVDAVPTCEVVCSDELALTALQLVAGQAVKVAGEMCICFMQDSLVTDSGWHPMRLEVHATRLVLLPRFELHTDR
jgi:hypothetical protein